MGGMGGMQGGGMGGMEFLPKPLPMQPPPPAGRATAQPPPPRQPPGHPPPGGAHPMGYSQHPQPGPIGNSPRTPVNHKARGFAAIRKEATAAQAAGGAVAAAAAVSPGKASPREGKAEGDPLATAVAEMRLAEDGVVSSTEHPAEAADTEATSPGAGGGGEKGAAGDAAVDAAADK